MVYRDEYGGEYVKRGSVFWPINEKAAMPRTVHVDFDADTLEELSRTVEFG